MRTLSIFLCLALLGSPVFARVSTVEEEEPRRTYIATAPSEKLFVKRTESKDTLLSNMTFGIIQGVDSNPLLDSTHKADNYTEENLDMNFRYPIAKPEWGKTNARFGFNVANVNYYNTTDINILDGRAHAYLEQDIFDVFTVGLGYDFEFLWFPNDANGSFTNNELGGTIKHKITKNLYQKGAYRFGIRNYLHRKQMIGNGTLTSRLREDFRNSFEHELGIYIGKRTKLRIVNQFYINDSNFQYLDYYDYFIYRTGGSVVNLLTKKFYNTTGVYYQMKDYFSRTTTDNPNSTQKDDLFIITTSFLYDITKSASIFINYSYRQNFTNEPLETYSDNLYTAGLYYSF